MFGSSILLASTKPVFLCYTQLIKVNDDGSLNFQYIYNDKKEEIFFDCIIPDESLNGFYGLIYDGKNGSTKIAKIDFD